MDDGGGLRALRLRALGLRVGEEIRFAPYGRGRPEPAFAAGVEPDGSITVVDSEGRRRSLPVERIEVRRAGPRGGREWEPLSRRMARPEQLSLLE